jgi:hypothetical protein
MVTGLKMLDGRAKKLENLNDKERIKMRKKYW